MKLVLKPNECLAFLTKDTGKEMKRYKLKDGASLRLLYESDELPSTCISVEIQFHELSNCNRFYINYKKHEEDVEIMLVEDKYAPSYFDIVKNEEKVKII